VEGRTVKVRVEQDLCMASQSCISLAPKVFRIDWDKRKSSFEGAPIEVKDEKAADNETIFLAAQSCPWQAIILEDADTGERLFP
jgi:ferredoxin